MEANRECDAKIAELRGWVLIEHPKEIGYWIKPDGSTASIYETPCYTTYIGVAMELWDEMWESGDFDWMSLVRSKEAPEFYLYWAGEPDGEEEVSDSSEKPAGAICNAYEEWKWKGGDE